MHFYNFSLLQLLPVYDRKQYVHLWKQTPLEKLDLVDRACLKGKCEAIFNFYDKNVGQLI